MVLPIDLQTVVGQMNNAGRIQQQQQSVAMELQNAQIVKDAKRLKDMDSQVSDTKRVDSNEVKDATKKSNSNKYKQPEKKENKDTESLSSEQGRIIDISG